MSEMRKAQSWEDWGTVDPMYAILTDPQFRFGKGDLEFFLSTGAGTIDSLLKKCDRLGICQRRESALDFGCGLGRLTAPLSAHFDSVIGLDVAATMVTQARAMHGDRCQFAVWQETDLAIYPSKSFDLVVSLLVLQHLPSRALMEGFMAEFVRILRPSGALVLNLPAVVPKPPVLPSWKTKEGIRKRLGIELRRAGVSPDLLYRRLDWVPEMTMTAIPDLDARRIFEAAGGEIRFVTEPTVDSGGTEDRTYYVGRRS